MVIHLVLAPLDRELPSLTEVRARRELADRLLLWIDGELNVEGDELWLEVDDAAEALPLVEQVLAELGLEPLVTIDLLPE